MAILKLSTISALTVTFALLQGCAGFKGNQLAEVEPADLKVAQNSNIKIYDSWTFESTNGFVNKNVQETLAEKHKKSFEDAIKSADCCIVVNDPSQADLIVTGRAINESNAAAMIPALITGFSLYTIPSWATSKVHLVVEVKQNGKKLDYDLKDHATLVQWLPMMFVFPFANPFTMEQEVAENAHRTLVAKLIQEGALQ
jgi:hypothetical protein